MKQPNATSLRNHHNNFDLLRLAGALLVLFSHAMGEVKNGPVDFLYRFTNNRYSLRSAGLLIFFSISGYLVTASLIHSASPGQYAWKRILRICPGYIVVTLLTVFILGPVFTSLPLHKYFSDSLTWKFLYKNVLLITSEKRLPGLFNGRKINISAWTLPFEMKLYGVILLLYLARIFRYRWLQAVVFSAAVMFKIFIPVQLLQHWFHFDFTAWYDMGFFFIAASTLYVWRDRIPLNVAGIGLLAFLWGVSIFFKMENNVPESLLLVYSIIYLGLKAPVPWRPQTDISYGMYIYGSPIQGMISWVTKFSLSFWSYMLFTLPLTIVMGLLSWHLVEKKALQYKNKMIDWPYQGPASLL